MALAAIPVYIIKSNFIPVRVQNVTTEDITSAVTVSWTEFTDFDPLKYGAVQKYLIERKTNSGAWEQIREFREIDWANGFYTYDTAITRGNTYTYRIKAVTSTGFQTDWSQEASITLEEDEPTEIFNPPSISYEIIRGSGAGIKISWVADPNNTVTPTRYEMDKWVNDVPNPSFQNLSPEDGSAVDSVVDFGNVYKYRFRGFHPDHGTTDWSNQITVNYEEIEESPAQNELITFSSTTFPSDTCKYDLYLPKGYNEGSNFPVLISLHGLGEFRDKESGSESAKDALIWKNGPAKLIRQDADMDAIGAGGMVIISPQQPFGVWQGGNAAGGDSWSKDYITEIVNIAKALKTDPDRIYMSGLSMGGKGVVYYASEKPQDIAAIVAISPASNVGNAAVLAANVPTWFVHGASDTTGGGFEAATTQSFYNSMLSVPPTVEVKFSKPSGVGHDSWTKTYDNTGDTWTMVADGLDPIGGSNSIYAWLKSK